MKGHADMEEPIDMEELHDPLGPLNPQLSTREIFLGTRGGDSTLYQEELAYELLSSLSAWDRTNENHRAETPKRFVQALKQLTEREEFNFTTFDNVNGLDEMVVVDNIGYVAVCAHHVLPFFGKAHIGYVPNGRIAGLSKFPRTVKNLAKGLHVQEELTMEIADFLEEKLDPKGLAVILTGRHMCMELRGVKAEGSYTTTSAMRGVFLDPSRGARAEFLQLIRN